MGTDLTYDKYCCKSFTRDEYMEGKVKHEQYYSQFVTRGMLDYLKATLKTKIELSEDPSFNDIPLKIWDRMPSSLLPFKAFYKLNRGVSPADKVCAFKAAARIIKSESRR